MCDESTDKKLLKRNASTVAGLAAEKGLTRSHDWTFAVFRKKIVPMYPFGFQNTEWVTEAGMRLPEVLEELVHEGNREVGERARTGLSLHLPRVGL